MFVLTMACVILLVDLFLSDARRGITYGLTQLTLVGAILLTARGMSSGAIITFNGMFIGDALASFLKLVIYIVTIFVFAYSRDYLRDRGLYRGEYYVLGLFGVVGMMVMASASHFLTLYLGLELLSLSVYAMVAFQRDSAQSTEAAMKYFVLGAMASGLLLYGMSMLYGMTGSLEIGAVRKAIAGLSNDNLILIFGLVFVVVGIAFKLGAVPFHMWVPDVYHGAPTAVTVYLGTAPKLAAFALVMRLLISGLEGLAVSWQSMFIILAVLSMATGNVIAIAQDNIKRMLAYSSISHMGFFLLGVVSVSQNGYTSALFYVVVYAVMSLGAFGMVILLSRAGFEAERLEDFKGLNQRSPWHAFVMLLIMISMAGVPPTFGFYAKLMVIQSVISAGMIWLAVVAVLLAVIGAFYYLRVIKLMYFDDAVEKAPVGGAADVRVLMGVNALALILLIPWAGNLMEVCRSAIRALAAG